jgi:hypothetical protein
MHWSASRSNEYCFADRTAAQSAFCAAKNCPESDGFADFWDSCFLEVLTPPKIPYAFCVGGYNPKAFCDAHRKKPASAARHRDAYMLPQVVSDGRYDTIQVPVEAVFPSGRIRRMRQSGRWMQVCLYICESVFFRAKAGIIAFLPRLGSTQPNLVLTQNPAKRFEADGRNNLFGNKIFSQLFKRPSLKRTTQKVRRTFGGLGDKCLVVLGKFRGSSAVWLWFQRLKAGIVEFLDNGPDVVLGVVNKLCDGGDFVALIGSENYLGASDFNPAGAAAKDSLNFLSFPDTEVSCIQTHKKSLSNSWLFPCVCLYNTDLRRAQVLNGKNVKLIF